MWCSYYCKRFSSKMSPVERVPCFAEHCCPVQCHPHHPSWHDPSYPLCESRPRVAAGHRLLGHPGVLQLRLWPRNHHLHWDEQDQGYCHQRSYLHGDAVNEESHSSVMPCKVFLFVVTHIAATNHLLSVCAVKEPLRPWCGIQCCTFVSGEAHPPSWSAAL